MSILNFDFGSIGNTAEKAAQSIGDFFSDGWDKFKGFIQDDIQPIFKVFVGQFIASEGKLVVQIALEEAPKIPADGFGTVTQRVMSRVISESAENLTENLPKLLQQVQSALQVAKVDQNITTTADQTIIANVAAETKVAG